MQEDNQVIFDTHKQVKKFMSVGLTEAQAEAQVEVFIQFIDGNLATKRSLLEVEAALKKDLKEIDLKIDSVEANLKRDIKELDLKIENVEANLKRDIKELDFKVENVEANLKRDLKELDFKVENVEANLKRDLKELDFKVENVEANLKRDIKHLEMNLSKEITIKMGIMTTVTISVLTAVMKLIN